MPAETLAVLTEISQEINASLNLDEVLAKAATQIKRLIDFAHAKRQQRNL